MQVSHETIYQALYVPGRGLLRWVAAALLSERATRRPQRFRNMVIISDRPQELENRRFRSLGRRPAHRLDLVEVRDQNPR